jgi:hypothetical protein
MPKYPSPIGMHRGGQILNFQNTLDRAWNEIRMKIQTENFFGILISTRLPLGRKSFFAIKLSFFLSSQYITISVRFQLWKIKVLVLCTTFCAEHKCIYCFYKPTCGRFVYLFYDDILRNSPTCAVLFLNLVFKHTSD